MNHLVEIIYSKNGKYPRILINGEQISRYMSLSDYICDDIFYWVDDFFEIIDSELAEGYKVALTGHPYHEIVLRSAMHKSEFCEEISFEEITHRISVMNKYSYALDLNSNYSLIPPQLGQELVFFCANLGAFAEIPLSGLTFTAEKSNYSIALEGDDTASLTGKYRVIVGENDKAVKQHGAICLYVTREHLPILIDYLNTYHIRLSAIEEIFAKMSDRIANRTVTDRPLTDLSPASRPLAARADRIPDEAAILEFEAYANEEYRVFVNKLPSVIESGTSFEVDFRYFPKCFAEPDIKVSVSDPTVVSCADGVFTAKQPGRCMVFVTDDSGTVYSSQQIEVFCHNYVKNIVINVPATTMEIGETLTFSTVLTPADAEDINEIVCRVSDESVAVLNAPDQLYALASGSVCVTVSTPRVEKSFTVTVSAQPTGIEVSQESIEIVHHSEATVMCSVVPENVSKNTKVIWAVTDKEIIRIKGSNSKKCCIESAGVGSALLMCKIEGTNIVKKIPVTVKKKKGCYVATAVYGSYDCPEVWALRRFRDRFLEKHWLGRRFIDVYYSVSPKAVKIFGKRKWFNRFCKGCLDRFVRHLNKNGYDKTYYED